MWIIVAAVGYDAYFFTLAPFHLLAGPAQGRVPVAENVTCEAGRQMERHAEVLA